MKIILPVAFIFFCQFLCAQVLSQSGRSAFPLVSPDGPTPILVSTDDAVLVQKAAALFREDVKSITGQEPQLFSSIQPKKNIIIIGTLQSAFVAPLVKNKKLNAGHLQGKWEGFRLQLVDHPFGGIEKALVIAGSDRRGTAYGVFELSQQLGVSPWYWWADVPVKKRKEIYLRSNFLIEDAPKVKYRGIFLNDEAPALSGWSKEKFGGFNHLFYEKVFELMLRLKANYLWPAMWGNAFYDDDPMNIKTADDFGIVIGTSHHEPLMRAHDEWRRYGSGKWNYDSNELKLKEFWRTGMQRATNEKIVSIGMRGDGDEPMSRETATALLERIVKDQRTIIEEVTGKPAASTPQLWALYKEVQDYYDKGMRVPDDVTLLLCDDNWGNIRKLPALNEKPRSGGYGIYYHFDYVGGPRNYKWINTNNIARVWEQMHLAYAHDVDRIWIVNVGDLKPMEFPISFFLDYAWDPDKWNEDNLTGYFTQWSAAQFGKKYAKDIGELIQKYSQFNARRKPELLSPDTYSALNYDETNRVVNDYKDLLEKAERINGLLPPLYRDAYFQLVLHPISASANLNELYAVVASNRFYARAHSTTANGYADRAMRLYQNDSLITLRYHTIVHGKWNHMMDQTHIGYTYWQQPPENKMPAVQYISVDSLSEADSVWRIIPDRRAAAAPGRKENVFFELNGYVSMEAAHFTNRVNSKNIDWKVIPGIGRTNGGITTFPVTVPDQIPPAAPRVEYEFYSYDTGRLQLDLYFSPTLNFRGDALKYAISIDDEDPQVFALNLEDTNVRSWEKWVADNIIIKSSTHNILKKGKHVAKYWMVSPAIILQKLVLHFGDLKPSYLGPPETKIP